MRGARAALSSGWLPAAAVFVVMVRLLDTKALVSASDTLWYTVWFAWLHVVPGTVIWRLVDWRRPDELGRGRPFLEDIVLGTMVGIIAAIPVYLALVASGVPRLVVLWPLLVLVPALCFRRGRSVLRRRSTPMPAWWSWGLALVVLYFAFYCAGRNWAPWAFSAGSLPSPYIDEPFHLSLVAEFRHHFPAEVPYVDGTPLRYHWLVYPVIALQTWASGVAPVVVLRMLAPSALAVLVILGAGVAASRLSGHRWAALAGAAVLVVLSPLDVMGWSEPAIPWVSQRWFAFLSPTQSLATALTPLLVVLVVALARGAVRHPGYWAFTGAVMLACAGAKSPMLPLFIGGLVGTTVVMLVLRRPAVWRIAALSLLSIAVFGLAVWLFYGPGGRSMSFSPLSLVDYVTGQRGLGPPDAPAVTPVRLTVAFAMTVAILAPMAGGLGLFVRGGWRRPTPWILLGTSLGGLAAILLLGHPGLSQGYFLFCGAAPIAIFAAMGLARLGGRLDRRTAGAMVAAGVLGAVVAYVVAAVSTPTLPDTPDDTAGVLGAFLVPLGLAALAVVLVVVLVGVAARRWDWLRGRRLLLALFVIAGMCAPQAVSTSLRSFDLPDPRPRPPNVIIPPGGIRAASWLRHHSTPDQLVATNSHRWQAAVRNFWISAYSERRILVEGWAYVDPSSVGLPSNDITNAPGGPPFWNVPLLQRNDRVFTDPTEANLRDLQKRYGVDWLFVDRAERPDIRGLEQIADLEYRTRRFFVFRVPSEGR